MDASLKVDFGWMLRERLALPGERLTGTLRWTRNGEPTGNINYICDMRDPEQGTLELRFNVTRHSTGETRDYVQRIALSYTKPNFGGKRWWMHCPVKGIRVGKLYCPNGRETFASREAWRLGYASQRISERDRPFEALFRLQKQLGCPQGWEQPIWRPKGMWRKTYAKLEAEYRYLDGLCAVRMMQVLDRFGDFRSLKTGG